MFRSLVRDYVLRSERRRLRATLRWIKRAERYYIRNCADIHNLGMCVSFMSTCPWWLSRSLKVSDVIPEFTRDGLTSLFPSQEWNSFDYLARPTVHVDALRGSYWWPITDRCVRMRVLRHLQAIYLLCLL